MGSHISQAPNKDYISSNSFPLLRRIIKFTHNPRQSTGHKVKSNNENKIVTTRLVKAKDGERRIEKALKSKKCASLY